ncbi:helix-turn-helix transcriptional regulator [Hyphomicrobium sp.]|uniref:helix-turn-helix transcriptional regulator n=1 Tax=Hyphomicrobium sp. TaxID=82 RepID=UPI003457E51A
MDKWHGRQITAARALAGLTITELATAAGVTERTIGRIESAGTITISERLTHGANSQLSRRLCQLFCNMVCS